MSDDEATTQNNVTTRKEPRLRQSRSTPWRRVGPEVMLAPLGTQDVRVLSGSGAVIWQFLEEPDSETELIEAIADAYSVPREEVAEDVRTLVATLLQDGLIEEVAEADGSGR